MKLTLSILPDTLAICRCPAETEPPKWAAGENFFSVTKTNEELSIVCLQASVPEEVPADRGWRCFKVEGPLNLALTGVLASLANPLAEARLNIFAVSTYDTDYLLVKEKNLARAAEVLSAAGHRVLAGK